MRGPLPTHGIVESGNIGAVAGSGKVVILCGGRGTRLREHAAAMPKPLVEIGARPIIWHVIQIYAHQGYADFVLLTGYRGEQIERWAQSATWAEDVSLTCVDTGLDTPTGGRLKLAASQVGDQPFMLSYADGVADIDLESLTSFHESHDGIATLTAVKPVLPFGLTEIDDSGRVRGFQEKPRLDRWINTGFFRLESGVFDYLDEDSVLEREPLERLANDGQLHAYRHESFWHPMDTYKDQIVLNDLWASGEPPWRVWTEEPIT